MPHAYPRDRKLEKGEGVVIDMGCDIDGYMSDLTRTIFLGKPDDQFKKIYDIVLTAQLTAEEMVKPGMTGDECHMIAHNVIEAAGYGDTFGHGLGHGIGLQVHEAPRVARTSTDVLQGQHGVHDRARHLRHRLGRRAHRGHGRAGERQGARDEQGAEASVRRLTRTRGCALPGRLAIPLPYVELGGAAGRSCAGAVATRRMTDP